MRVVLATDRRDLGRALSLFLSERRVDVVLVTDDAGALLACATCERPDAVLVDWRLGEARVSHIVAELMDGDDRTPVVVLSSAPDGACARLDGAAGSVALGDHPEALLAALREACPSWMPDCG